MTASIDARAMARSGLPFAPTSGSDRGRDHRTEGGVRAEHQDPRGSEDRVADQAEDACVQPGDGRKSRQLRVRHPLRDQQSREDEARHQVLPQPAPTIGPEHADAGHDRRHQRVLARGRSGRGALGTPDRQLVTAHRGSLRPNDDQRQDGDRRTGPGECKTAETGWRRRRPLLRPGRGRSTVRPQLTRSTSDTGTIGHREVHVGGIGSGRLPVPGRVLDDARLLRMGDLDLAADHGLRRRVPQARPLRLGQGWSGWSS